MAFALTPRPAPPTASKRRPVRAPRRLLGLVAAIVSLHAAPTLAVCHAYEYQLYVRRFYSWPEGGLYVADVDLSLGETDGSEEPWWFLDRELRRLPADADAVRRLLAAVGASGREGEGAMAAALVAAGARPLARSDGCLRALAPCSGLFAGRTWRCELAWTDGQGFGWGLGPRTLGCFEDGGRTIALTEVASTTGADCHTLEQWVRHVDPPARDLCPECRTGHSSTRQWIVVPVLGLPRGEGPAVRPLGFGTDGRLFFRFRTASGQGLGAFDPAAESLQTRGVVLPRALRPIPKDRRASPAGSFEAGGAVYTLVPAGPADARSDEFQFLPAGERPPLRSWTATLVSHRDGLQPFALLSPYWRGQDDPEAAWPLIVRSPVTAHLVAIGTVQREGDVEVGFFAARQRAGAFGGWPDPLPLWPERQAWEPVVGMVGFSPSGLLAWVSGEPPTARGRRGGSETVTVVRLADDAVLLRAPLAESGASLRRYGIVPGIFPALAAGGSPLVVGGSTFDISISPADGAVRIGTGGRTKRIGSVPLDEVPRPGEGEVDVLAAVSPFEPLAAVVVSTPRATHVFGAHLTKGFAPAPSAEAGR